MQIVVIKYGGEKSIHECDYFELRKNRVDANLVIVKDGDAEVLDNVAVVKSVKAESEEKSCDDTISRQYLLDNCVVDKVTMPYVPVNKIKNAPSVIPQQDLILDKIRAELEELYGKHVVRHHVLYGPSPEHILLSEVLQIIDKYKAEEEKG